MELNKSFDVKMDECPEFPLDLPDHGILEDLDYEHSEICEGCAVKYIAFVAKKREQVWTQLPVRFLNKKWEEIN